MIFVWENEQRICQKVFGCSIIGLKFRDLRPDFVLIFQNEVDLVKLKQEHWWQYMGMLRRSLKTKSIEDIILIEE